MSTEKALLEIPTERRSQDILDNIIVEKTASDSVLEGNSPPDGGLEAWLTVVGGFLIYFCTLGYTNAYGVYQDFYVREFMTNKTPSEIAWIGSFQIALQFLLGMPVGKAFDAGYFHHVMIGGSLIYCFSIFMISLAKPEQYYQVFLAQSVGMGIGLGLTFLPVLSVAAHHFSRRRSFAIGVMTSGASFGGIVFPIMLNKLIHGSQGFSKGVRATAALVTGLMALANILMRTRPVPHSSQPNSQSFGVSALRLLKDAPYITCVASGFLVKLGFFFPIFYLQLFAVEHGIDENLAFYTVSFINAGGILGRLIPSFLADKLGSYNILIPIIFGIAAFILGMLGATTVAGVVVVSLLYGAGNAAYTSVAPALLADLSDDVNEVGIRMGLWFSCVAISSLFGQPISGALLTGKFFWSRGAVFSGVLVVAGALTLMLSRYLFIRQKGGSQLQRV